MGRNEASIAAHEKDDTAMTKSRNILPPKLFWTPAEVAILIGLYPDTLAEDIAARLGISVRRIYQKAKHLGLKKSVAFKQSQASGKMRTGNNRGGATRFKPGQKPWNTGMKGYVAGGRSPEFHFKPGHRGGRALKNYKPIGAERISKDGYLERKINEGMPFQRRWRAVHLIEWEAIHGPLPKGHALVFRNGDKTDIRLDNLELVTRAELMRRNSYHTNYPKEVGELIQLRGALVRKINRIRKENDEQRDHR